MDLNLLLIAGASAFGAGLGSSLGSTMVVARDRQREKYEPVDFDDEPLLIDDDIIETTARRWAESEGHPEAAPLFGTKVRVGHRIRARRRGRW